MRLVIFFVILTYSFNIMATCRKMDDHDVRLIAEDPRFYVEIPASLTTIEHFAYFFRCPDVTEDFIMDVISNEIYNDNEKIVVAYLAHSIDKEKYARHASATISLYINGLVSKSVMESLVFPSIEWNTYIPENYNRNEIKTMLLRLKSESDYNSEYFDSILSGDSLKDIIEMRLDGVL